jgi:hypothetical protein
VTELSSGDCTARGIPPSSANGINPTPHTSRPFKLSSIVKDFEKSAFLRLPSPCSEALKLRRHSIKRKFSRSTFHVHARNYRFTVPSVSTIQRSKLNLHQNISSSTNAMLIWYIAPCNHSIQQSRDSQCTDCLD